MALPGIFNIIHQGREIGREGGEPPVNIVGIFSACVLSEEVVVARLWCRHVRAWNATRRERNNERH